MKEMERSEHQEFGDIEEMDKEPAKTVKRVDGLPTVEDLKELLGGSIKNGEPKGMMVIKKTSGPMLMGGGCQHQEESDKLESLKQFLDGLMGLLQ